MKKVSIDQIPLIPASHEDREHPGVLKKVLYTNEDFTQRGKIQMINWAYMKPGKSFKSHYHEDMDEVFIILAGTVEIKIDNDVAILNKSEAVLIPAKSVHFMKNIGVVDVEYIVIGSSGGKGGKTITTKPL